MDSDFYAERGISVIPIADRSKSPPRGFRWKEFTERIPTPEERLRWFGSETRHGIAGVMGCVSGLIALDADTREKARELWTTLPRTDMVTRTVKGGHFLYRIEEGQIVPTSIRIAGMELDVKAELSYVLLAPSIHPTGKQYERIGEWDREKVPYFDPSWIQAENGKRSLTRGKVTNVDAYLARIESVQGKDGSSGLVRAAAVCRDAGLSEAECMAKLFVWNQGPTVRPPWTPEELARAVTRSYAKGLSNV